MKVAVIYARVSTDGQEDNFSLASQIEACQRYAQQNGLKVIGVCQDVASGSKIEREGLDRVRTLAQEREINSVIVYASDRLTRNVAHSYLLRDELKRNGVGLHYATRGQAQDTAEGGLHDGIEAVFAEYERLKINERTRRGRKRKLDENKVLGSGPAPYGYRWVGDNRSPKLEIVPEEAAIIRRIYDLFTVDRLGTFQVTQRLRAEGVHGRRGQLWGVSTTRYILHNRVYSGLYEHNRYEVTERGTRKAADPSKVVTISGSVEAIVPPEQWELAQQLLGTNKGMSVGNRKRFYLLAHRVRCGCGRGMSGVTKPASEAYRYYVCCKPAYTIAEACPTKASVNADRIEAAFWQAVQVIVTPEFLRDSLQAYRIQQQHTLDGQAHQISTLERERAAIEARHQKMIGAFQADAISLDDLRSSKERTQTELASIDRELARLRAIDGNVITPEEEHATLSLVQRMHALLGDLSDDDRRKVVEVLDLRIQMVEVAKHRLVFTLTSPVLGSHTVRTDGDNLSHVDKTVQIVLL